MMNLLASHIIMHHELYEKEDCRNYVHFVALKLMAMIVRTMLSLRMPI